MLEEPALRPISLVELQAAIEAVAPPPPPPPRASTPLPVEPPPPPLPEEQQAAEEAKRDRITPVLKKDRKRRSNIDVDDILNGCFTTLIDASMLTECMISLLLIIYNYNT